MSPFVVLNESAKTSRVSSLGFESVSKCPVSSRNCSRVNPELPSVDDRLLVVLHLSYLHHGCSSVESPSSVSYYFIFDLLVVQE